MAYYLPWLANTSGGGGDAYVWYPDLDLNDIPFHTASGDWGPQYTVAEATAPSTTTAVTVTTWSGFQSAMLAGSRQITIGADIDGSMGLIDGNVTDVDVIIPSGRILRSFNVNRFNNGQTCTRLRFRGPTVGTHSGGQLHNVIFYGQPTSDLIFDGIDITGPGVVANGSPPPDWVQQSAIRIGTSGEGERVAITNCRCMVGNYFFIGDVKDLIVTGSSFYSGAEPRQSSGVEGWVFRVIGPPDGGAHIFYNNDLRGTRFHKLRFHPDGSTTYCWIDSNYLVDMNEGRLLACSSALVSSPKGYYAGLWATNNECWTDINDTANAGPEFSSGSSAYVRFENNLFRSDELTGDGSLGISDVEGLIPNGDEDWLKTANTFSAGTAVAPSWKTGTPGDPTGLTWDIGE